MIVAVAVLAGVGGGLAPASPCGYPLADAFLNGLLAAIVALATSRARRWTWLWVSGVGAVLRPVRRRPRRRPWWPWGFRCGAAVKGGCHRVLGAVVGALAAQTLL